MRTFSAAVFLALVSPSLAAPQKSFKALPSTGSPYQPFPTLSPSGSIGIFPIPTSDFPVPSGSALESYYLKECQYFGALASGTGFPHHPHHHHPLPTGSAGLVPFPTSGVFPTGRPFPTGFSKDCQAWLIHHHYTGTAMPSGTTLPTGTDTFYYH